MCLAVPMRIVKVNDLEGEVDLGGATQKVRFDLIEDPREGEFVMVHAGFAIQKLDEQEAQKTLDLLREVV